MNPWVIVAAAGVAAIAAYVVACHLTGENLAAALCDELSLRARSIQDLDAACAANPRVSGLVVSLTSIPSRVSALEPTLKSLLRQTFRASEIRLCLPAHSVREGRPYAVPDWLRGLACVRIVTCEDEGPATKFLDTLRSVDADQPVAVVDDDRVYHRRLLERLSQLARSHPDEIIAGAGWNAPDDRVDHPTTLLGRIRGAPHVPIRANQIRRAREVDVVQGVHGYVIRPRFFDLAALGRLSDAPAAVRYVDDVWLSAHARVRRRVHPLPLPFTDYLPWAGRARVAATSLGRNVNRAEDPAQRGNSVALRHFSDRWRK